MADDDEIEFYFDSNETWQTNFSYYNMTNDGNGERTGHSLNVSLVVPAVMFAAGFFGNLLALFVLFRSPREQKRTVFYRLVGGLAFTDLFGTVATSPVTLVIYSNNLKWVGGQPLCNYFSFMLIFAGFATVFIICCMALDRYIALRKPYLYSAKITYHKVKYILLAMWMAAFLMACLPLVGIGENVKHYPGSWCFFDFNGKTFRVKLFAYLYSIVGLIVILTICVLNLFVIVTVWKMRQFTSAQKIHTNVKCIDSEIQMVIFLVGILAVFGLCYSPLMVRVLIIQILGMTGPESDDLLVIRLASFNQILDPWVYLLFRKEFFNRFYTFSKKTCLKESSPAKSIYAKTEMGYISENMVTEKPSDSDLDCESAEKVKLKDAL